MFFSDEVRQNPYPLYEQLRKAGPVHYIPPPFDAWTIVDYAGVKWALNDHETFSSQVPAPPNWFIFSDPPNHTKLRGLISQAFTPRMVANLEPKIRELSSQLLQQQATRGEMDLVADYATPLPMMVIAEMIGLPPADWPRFHGWSDAILKLSYTRSGDQAAAAALMEFRAAEQEMNSYLSTMMEERRSRPKDDLLTLLMAAEFSGEKLTQPEILGFLELLVVAGQETTTNLISNAVLCLIENPEQRKLLEMNMELAPPAIEEVLRFRSPLQWMMRKPKRDVELQGKVIPAGKLVLTLMGSANRDERQFPDAGRFDITRDPNPHVAFGHGIHFCLGAPLSRLEARIALTDILQQLPDFEPAYEGSWQPRDALHVHGPKSLPLRFTVRERSVSA